MIPTPYLLYIGNKFNEFDIKTSRGLAVFRPEACVGEYRHDACPLTLGLARMTFEEAVSAGAKTLVLGIANAGGSLGEGTVDDAVAAVEAGLDIASGLHQRLRDEPRLVEAAQRYGRTLHDVRDPRPDLPVGNGERRRGKRLLAVGTDCSVGKMYTTLRLTNGLRDRGVAANFRATGQTGILIAGEGVPLDAVVADFIAGAIEQLAPAREDGGWDLIEGQGSLFHPSFAGVSTGLLHGAQPAALVLCHDPSRPHMRGLPHYPMPELGECLDANLRVARLTSPEVRAVGVSMNMSKLAPEAAARLCAETEDALGLPCIDPMTMSLDPILDAIAACDA